MTRHGVCVKRTATVVTTTFPRLLLEHAAKRPAAPALREKEYGIWQTTSWAELAAMVRAMACGLAVVSTPVGAIREAVNLSNTCLPAQGYEISCEALNACS